MRQSFFRTFLIFYYLPSKDLLNCRSFHLYHLPSSFAVLENSVTSDACFFFTICFFLWVLSDMMDAKIIVKCANGM